MRVHGSDFSHRHCRSGHLPALQCQHVAAGCAQMAICYGCSNVRLRHMVVQCAMMCFFCTTGRLFKAPASQNFAVPRLLQDLDHSKCLGWRSAASTRPVCNVGYDNASRGGATMPDILQWAMRTSGLITLQLRCIIVSLHSGSSVIYQGSLAQRLQCGASNFFFGICHLLSFLLPHRFFLISSCQRVTV